MSTKRIYGLIMTIISVIGALYSIITISNDKSGLIRYTYAPPFTAHETVTLAILVISVIIGMIGIVLIAIKE